MATASQIPIASTQLKPDVLEHEEIVLTAMRRGVRNALRRHKALGESIVIERDGRIVTVPPDQIQVDDEPTA